MEKNKQPFISIIVPVFNVEKYIYKCMESLLLQTFTDYEIILVDDGSTDKSGIICDNYKMQDNRIKVIHKKNQGLSSARNAGIKEASGKYLTFLDSDDWVNADTYQILYREAIKDDAEIIQCNLKKVKAEKPYTYIENYENRITVYSKQKALKCLYADKNSLVWCIVCNKLYKKELFSNLEFPVGKVNEDNYVNYKLLDRATKVVFVDLPLYYYRQRRDSIMGMERTLSKFDKYEAFVEQTEYFEKKGNHELCRRTLARREGYLFMQYQASLKVAIRESSYYRKMRRYWFCLIKDMRKEKVKPSDYRKFLKLLVGIQIHSIRK